MTSTSLLRKMNFQMALPQFVKKAYTQLRADGHIAYIVGGSVRDALLQLPTKDFDLATSATPDQILKSFPMGLDVGKNFGVIKIPLSRFDLEKNGERTKEKAPKAGHLPEDPVQEFLEIATFRKDIGSVDYRHPKRVEFLGPAEDAARRDFTVNGLFFDPSTQTVLDYVGGLTDLKEKVVRAIGQPALRFREDALRLLRAVRFTASLGFVLEARTAKAIEGNAALIRKISAERVRDELNKIWLGPRPAVGLRLMRDLGLLSHTIPELNALAQIRLPRYVRLKPWEQTLRFLELFGRENSEKYSGGFGREVVAWAGLFAYLGKIRPASEGTPENLKIAKEIGLRLKFPREMIETIQKILMDVQKFKEIFEIREARLIRFLREPHFRECLELHRLLALSSDGDLAAYQYCQKRWEKEVSLQYQPLISGEDLLELGLSPGKLFTEILDDVEDQRLEGKLNSKQNALEYVLKMYVH